jgi:hypothetical protein
VKKRPYYKPAHKSNPEFGMPGFTFLKEGTQQTALNAKQLAACSPVVAITPPKHKHGVSRERMAQISNGISEGMCQASVKELIAVVKYYRELFDETHRALANATLEVAAYKAMYAASNVRIKVLENAIAVATPAVKPAKKKTKSSR